MAAARRRRIEEEELRISLTPSEITFFDRLKAAVGGREAWLEVLKCFDLYAAEVLTKAELMTLLQDVIGASAAGSAASTSSLLDGISKLLNNRGDRSRLKLLCLNLLLHRLKESLQKFWLKVEYLMNNRCVWSFSASSLA